MTSKYSIKCNVSARHKGQRSIFVFPWTSSTINHSILYVIFTSFNDHIYFVNSVFLLCCLWLKTFLWFPNRSLKIVAASPKYIFSHRWFQFQHLFYILYLEFDTNSGEDKYYSLYICIYIWCFWVAVTIYYTLLLLTIYRSCSCNGRIWT